MLSINQILFQEESLISRVSRCDQESQTNSSLLSIVMSDFSPGLTFLGICSIHYSKQASPGTVSLKAQIFQEAKSTGKVKFQRLLELQRAARCHGEGSWWIPTGISRLLKKSLSFWNWSICPQLHVRVTWEASENLKVKAILRLTQGQSHTHDLLHQNLLEVDAWHCESFSLQMISTCSRGKELLSWCRTQRHLIIC